MNGIDDGPDEFNYSQSVYWLDWLETGDPDSFGEAYWDFTEDREQGSDTETGESPAALIVSLETWLHQFAAEHLGAGNLAVYDQARIRIDSLGLLLAKRHDCFDEWIRLHVRASLSGGPWYG
jgi:hypothetical protein